MKKILIIDDSEVNREILTGILSEKYEIATACNGEEGIEKIKDGTDYSLILLDLVMPVIDGFGVLDYMKNNGLFLIYPVIIISSDCGAKTESRCFDYSVSDFIAKPFHVKIVLQRIENVISLKEYNKTLENAIQKQRGELELQNRQLIEQANRLSVMNEKIIELLGNVVESRNLESGEHVKRVCGFTKILGLQYIKDNPDSKLTAYEVELISKAAALHDIGKISIPDNILLKPGKLTPDEFEIMKTHSLKGCEILDKITGIWDDEYQKTSYEICRYHHEKYDGKGYPDGLKGEEIPLSAQIVSIADCYDALITKRVYKDAFPKDQAYQMILDGECGNFSPTLLESFKNARTKFEEYVDKSLSSGVSGI